MDIKEQWQSGHLCYQFHSPLQVLFLLFDTTAQHPQHCWQEESPCRSSQALLKEQLLMDHRKCCSVWNFHSLGLWWNEWPLKKVSCPSVVISALCSHSGCVKKKNEVPVLATTIIWWVFFSPGINTGQILVVFSGMSCLAKFQLLSGTIGNTDFALESKHSASGVLM